MADKKLSWKKLAAGMALLGAIAGSVATVSGYTLKDLMDQPEPDPTSELLHIQGSDWGEPCELREQLTRFHQLEPGTLVRFDLTTTQAWPADDHSQMGNVSTGGIRAYCKEQVPPDAYYGFTTVSQDDQVVAGWHKRQGGEWNLSGVWRKHSHPSIDLEHYSFTLQRVNPDVVAQYGQGQTVAK